MVCVKCKILDTPVGTVPAQWPVWEIQTKPSHFEGKPVPCGKPFQISLDDGEACSQSCEISIKDIHYNIIKKQHKRDIP